MDANFWRHKRVVALSGGIGGARLVDGLYRLLEPGALDVIVNTGDDFEHLSVFVSPDIDTVMYTLAELAPVDRGWGVADDSDQAMRMVQNLGEDVWFNLGDRDLGTNLLRTARLREGHTLSQVTDDFRRALDITCRIHPMADSPHPTRIHTHDGRILSFQRWLVQERGEPAVAKVELSGDKIANQAALDAIRGADLVVIPPSNPWVSVEPILELRGVREALAGKPVIGVSPIVHGQAVKGPLAAMIRSIDDKTPSARAVAARYGALLSAWFVAHGDSFDDPALEVIESDIIMQNIEGRVRVARELLIAGERLLR